MNIEYSVLRNYHGQGVLPGNTEMHFRKGVEEGFDGFKAAISLAMGALFGGGAVGGMKRSMKTAVKQTQAENYIRGGVNLRGERDTFINRSVTRTRIRQENNSSSNRPSGGHFGGTTISGSHGGSHHSGKF